MEIDFDLKWKIIRGLKRKYYLGGEIIYSILYFCFKGLLGFNGNIGNIMFLVKVLYEELIGMKFMMDSVLLFV